MLNYKQIWLEIKPTQLNKFNFTFFFFIVFPWLNLLRKEDLREKGKDWKGEGRRRGNEVWVAGGVLPMLKEPESPLEELKLPMGELEPPNERLTISLTIEGFFFSKKKKEMQE